MLSTAAHASAQAVASAQVNRPSPGRERRQFIINRLTVLFQRTWWPSVLTVLGSGLAFWR